MEDREGAARLQSAIATALGAFTGWFGPIDRDRRITVIEIPEGWGSQASLAGGIIQTADAFRDAGSEPQLYHELAHLWHPRDLDRPAVRWNEGFATFVQWRMQAHRDSEGDPTRALEALAQAMASLAARELGRQSGDPVPMSEFGARGLTGRSYGTGALLFYAIYRVLGPDTFDQTVASYFAADRSDGTTVGRMVDALSGPDPNRISAVFDDWFFTTRWIDRLAAGASLPRSSTPTDRTPAPTAHVRPNRPQPTPAVAVARPSSGPSVCGPLEWTA